MTPLCLGCEEAPARPKGPPATRIEVMAGRRLYCLQCLLGGIASGRSVTGSALLRPMVTRDGRSGVRTKMVRRRVNAPDRDTEKQGFPMHHEHTAENET